MCQEKHRCSADVTQTVLGVNRKGMKESFLEEVIPQLGCAVESKFVGQMEHYRDLEVRENTVLPESIREFKAGVW